MKDKTIGFTILALKTEQFAIFAENYLDNKKSNLATGLDFKIALEQKTIGVFTTFTFEQDEKAFLRIQVTCHFGIIPDSWEKCILNNEIIFPKNFMTHLATLAIGSARGVLHAKTENTQFNKFLLPTIDISTIIGTDIKFSLS